MKKFSLIFVAILVSCATINAQSKKTKDRNAIKEMCGCFEVTFNFSETFAYSEDSLYLPSKQKIASALEWAQLVKDEKDKISIQHLLQVGTTEHQHIVKHWRQDWLFQNRDFYMFNANNQWVFEQKSKDAVKKQWTQKVYQVDDSPRYEGSATWVHVDGKSYWENATDAPLPRREYTKRNDYNLMKRWNRIEITDNGWIHKQNNSKVLKTEFESMIIAKEIGSSPYEKVNYKRCNPAMEWWNTKQSKWNSIREEWDKIYVLKKDISMKKKVDGMFLYEHLMFTNNYEENETHGQLINSFLN